MRPCPKCGVLSPVGSAVCAACGAALAPAAGHDTVPGAPLGAALPAPGAAGGHLVGTLVDGKYTIERVLGEGGMGVVYLAKAEHTGTEVVLKAIRPEVAHRQDLRERTLSEGRALARIDHPNVVHLNAVVTEHDALWLVMQYVEGESLEQRLAREAARGALLPLAEALLVFRQILAGVEAAHREGIIHRDLKPANILIRAKDGVVKVTDFGIAKGEEDAQAGRGQTKGIIGSLYYMAPEQVHGQRDLDRRVDVYAMGIVLYQMLEGEGGGRLGEEQAEGQGEGVAEGAAPTPSVSAARRGRGAGAGGGWPRRWRRAPWRRAWARRTRWGSGPPAPGTGVLRARRRREARRPRRRPRPARRLLRSSIRWRARGAPSRAGSFGRCAWARSSSSR
ncbi:MAG: serine/threonine protein kinase [Deltaproteobacteria bacterium]|nr:serine/threonine protein kinase [Deltaproteobacteria bacterium]